MMSLTAYADINTDKSALEETAQSLGLTLVFSRPEEIREATDSPAPSLVLASDGLWLVGGGMKLRGDFSHLLPRLRPENLGGEKLIKATKIKGLADDGHSALIDATAGLGEDSFLLAAAGFEVALFERNPVIAALLRDALSRAESDPLLAAVARRMRFCEGDSADVLLYAANAFLPQPDVIYLDPMFPGRQKSGLVKKKFQLLHLLETPCDDADGEKLMAATMAARPKKIVVKRPAGAEPLAGVKPDYNINAGGIRFDCIVPR